MNEFLLLFRRDHDQEQPSPAELQASIKPWQEWLEQLKANEQLISSGNRLQPQGNVIRPGKVVTNGPYAEIKEAIGGFFIVKAADLEMATEIAKGCPILDAPWYGSVEVRMIMRD
jgi:hypothetical protein